MSIETGTRFGRYEIRSLLGKGGMGEVYLAQDTKLERAVALKILPAEVAQDQKRMQRFVQEAKSASSLNHPNIITIHEIEHADTVNFIATEFIDGLTLRQHLARERMELNKALDVATQVASALAAAHAAGIVHRDIKPENVMIRKDGYVKVLDFGLAKLTEPSASVDTEAATRALVGTDPGMVMGTARYMSPEQARGQEVDARTDIWSLGVVIYEMLAGRTPFEGSTASDMIASILKTEPPPLARFAREIPPEAEWIVTKALMKEREERYQTAKEMLVDLRRLKQRLDAAAEIERSVVPDLSSEAPQTTSGASQQASASTASGQMWSRTADLTAARPTTSAEYLVSEIKNHKRGAITIAAILLVALAGAAFALYKFLGQKGRVAPFEKINLTRVTNTGKSVQAAISPDGKYVVHVIEEAGQRSLWVRQVATNSDVQIVPPAEARYRGVSFSGDGNYVYYVRAEKNNSLAVLYQIPALGGTAKKIIEDVDSPITFSPDRKRLAFVRNVPSSGERVLILANADGTGEQKLATTKVPQAFNLSGPSWSPDGKTIACSTLNSDSGGQYQTLVGVNIADGSLRALSAQRWAFVGKVNWLADGGGLMMVAADQGAPQIWHVSYPGGESRRITNDLNSYNDISLTSDSTSLVTVQGETSSNIWVAPSADASRATRITSGKVEGVRGVAWTPDGRIVFASTASGHPDIWIVGADGAGLKQLTVEVGNNFDPKVTQDGRYIVFTSTRSGKSNIWRMEMDGGNATQLTAGSNDFFPACSPDSQWVIYISWNSGKPALWKVSINGGNPTQLIDEWTLLPAVSPDGKLVACDYLGSENVRQWKIALVPFDGGAPVKTLDIPFYFRGVNAEQIVRWTPEGRELIYIDNRGNLSNLWSQPVDGGQPKQLTDFKTDRIFNYDLTSDGKQFAFARGAVSSDVILISEIR